MARRGKKKNGYFSNWDSEDEEGYSYNKNSSYKIGNYQEEDDENEDESEDESEDSQDSGGQTASMPKVGGKGIFSKISSKVSKSIGKAVFKAGKAIAKVIWNIWKVLPIQVKIVIIIIITGLIIKIVMDINSSASADTTTQYASYSTAEIKKKISTSSGTDKTLEDAVNFFEKNNSFLMFRVSDINTFYDDLVKGTKDTGNLSTITSVTSDAYQTIYGSNDVSSDSRVVNPSDKIELYKHLLLTEKYNFNFVKWKEFGHGINGTDVKLKDDTALGLKYPDDSSKELNTFIDLLNPFLQSWRIPLAYHSYFLTLKNTTSNDPSKFMYSIIKDAYSDIVAHRYDMQTYTLNTSFKDYIETEYRSKFDLNIKVTSTFKPKIIGSNKKLIITKNTTAEKTESFIPSYDLNGLINSTFDEFISEDNTRRKAVIKSDGTLDKNATFSGWENDHNWNTFCTVCELIGQDSNPDTGNTCIKIKTTEYAVSKGNDGIYTSSHTGANKIVYKDINTRDIIKTQAKNKAREYCDGITCFEGVYNSNDTLNENATFASIEETGNYKCARYVTDQNSYRIIIDSYHVEVDRSDVIYEKDGAGNIKYTSEYKYEYIGRAADTLEQSVLSTKYVNTRKTGQYFESKEKAASVDDDPMMEDLESENTEIETAYYVKDANTFDVKVANEYNYIKYNDDPQTGSPARKNPTQGARETNIEDYYEEIDIANKITNSILVSSIVNTTKSINQVNSNSMVNCTENGFSSGDYYAYTLLQMKKPGEIVSGSDTVSPKGLAYGDGSRVDEKTYTNKYEAKGTYKIRDGKKSEGMGKHYVQRIWYDELIPTASTTTVYTLDDLIDFNAKYNSTANKTKYNDEQKKFNDLYDKTENSDSKEIYSEIIGNEAFNRINMINSNSKLFGEYVTEESPVSEIEGFSVTSFYACLDQLKTLLEEIADNNNKIPYVYGVSLGFSTVVNTAGNPVKNTYSGYAWPVPDHEFVGYIFGYSFAYNGTSVNQQHNGIDISGIQGYTVVAASEGKVISADDKKILSITGPVPNGSDRQNSGYGNVIVIDHGNGYYTRYGHLETGTFTVKTGDTVKKGQEIAKSGSSGWSTGYHLHFELLYDEAKTGNINNAVKIDPLSKYKVEINESSGNTIEYEQLLADAGLRAQITMQNPYKIVSSATSDNLKNVLHSWEGHEGIVEIGGIMYYVIGDDGAGHPTVGYGVDIFNGGFEQAFKDAGYPTEIGGYVPVEFVDALEENEINEAYEYIKTQTDGLGLTDYQIEAMVSRSYNCGKGGALSARNGKTFNEAYTAYWNSSENDKYFEKDADFNHVLFTSFMKYPETSEGKVLLGLQRRRRAEWIYFSTGSPALNGDPRIGI